MPDGESRHVSGLRLSRNSWDVERRSWNRTRLRRQRDLPQCSRRKAREDLRGSRRRTARPLAHDLVHGARCADRPRACGPPPPQPIGSSAQWQSHYNGGVLSRTLTFSRDQDESFFQELPAAAAVFLLRGEGEPYISKTANLRRRLQRLLGPRNEHSKRLNLRDLVRQIEFTVTGSDFESQFLLYRLLRETFPKTHAARLRLRPAPLVKLHLENEYPRASVTRHLGKLPAKKKEKETEGGETGVSPVLHTADCTGE